MADFYDESNWRNRHGIKGPLYGPTGHRGTDVGVEAGGSIPALRPDVVRLRQRSTILGDVVVIQADADDLFDFKATRLSIQRDSSYCSGRRAPIP